VKEYVVPSDLFEALRGTRSPLRTAAAPATQDVYFMISCSEGDAHVDVVNKKGKNLDCSYEFSYGAVREALKAMAILKERNTARFHWSGSSERLLLAENDHLIALLARTGKLVNAKMRPISLEIGTSKIQLLLSEQSGGYAAELALQTEDGTFDQFELLSEAYVLASDNRIFPIAPLGPRFADLHLFCSPISKSELEPYLTLLFSTLDNVTPVLDGYKTVPGALRQAEPCVIFEEVDQEGCLKLRVGSSLAGFEPEFMENYEIIRAATVNSLEHTVVVSDVVHQPVTDCIRLITSALKKVAKKRTGDFYQEESFFLIGPDLVADFLGEALPPLLSSFPCYGAEHLKRFKLRTSRPKLTVTSVGSGIDYLEATVMLEIDDQSIALSDALKYFRKQTYIPLNDGTKALINSDYLRRLERIFRRKGKSLKLSFFDLPFLEELIEENELRKVEGLEKASHIFEQLRQTEKIPLPRVKAKLRPYQQDGYQWMHRLHDAGLGGCLADDMGLGKTLQALALLQATWKRGTAPSMVVMPRSLLFNWQSEIAKFTPKLSCSIYHGANRDLTKCRKTKLLLTTYGTLRSDIEALKELPFHYLILDESQNIKNPNSQASKAVLLIQSQYRLALSGTPVENNLTELYALFRFLNPSMFESLPAFNRDYANPIAKDNDQQAMTELQRKIAPFMLRRTKRQVLKDLPDKVEQVLYVDMSEDQAALYESRRRFYHDQVTNGIAREGIQNCQFALMQAFTELRQIASTPESKTDRLIASPKREMVIQEIAEAASNGHKSLVFANFLGALDSLSDDLNEAGISHLVMTGATRDRESLVKRFQTDENISVFLMTLKTGGVGLNLTAADYVFIYDPWWNRAAESQAIDRTHRIGQKNTVFTYKLVARNTIEEKILKLQEQKGQIFENLVGSDGASLKSLTEDDVRFALGVD
jgi:superfamily II DNA or RNA helicase